MLPLLSKTAQKILTVLLHNPLQECNEIELITKAGTGKGSAAAFIDALVNEGLLLERRLGKTKMISLSLNHPAVFWLKNLMDQEKIKHLSKVQLATGLYFARESSAHLVILFGSTIAGTATAQSDIDLLVVSQDLAATEKARKRAEELWGQQLNLHIYSEEEISNSIENDHFTQNALIQGIILQGYDLASLLYSQLRQAQRKPLERLYYFKERIAAIERNYHQQDYSAAQEILSTLCDQLIFYILNEQKIPYQSKKDAAQAIMGLPEGKVFKSMKKKPLKQNIEAIHVLVYTMLTNTVLEAEGYGFFIRD